MTKLARETAEALFDGNIEKVFENQQKANAAYEKKLRADLVKQDPKPAGAGGGNEEKDEAVEFARSWANSEPTPSKTQTKV